MASKPKPHPANRSRADWMMQRLGEEGLRLTGQRETVVQAVADKPGAFNPEALVDELRPGGIGRATVYRTLDLLERRGMLARIHLAGCHGFTVCDEGHHHHLVCNSCSKVVPIDATDIETNIRQLADRLKFRLDTHTLEFAGLCEACQAAS
jgi:Fur family transcriptional regulator, ferric uptake regulator